MKERRRVGEIVVKKAAVWGERERESGRSKL